MALIKPATGEENVSSITFPLTYVGETRTKYIEIQNVGEIPCKVIMDITKNPSKNFVLETCEDSIQFLNLDTPGNKNKFSIKCASIPSFNNGSIYINHISHNSTEIY